MLMQTGLDCCVTRHEIKLTCVVVLTSPQFQEDRVLHVKSNPGNAVEAKEMSIEQAEFNYVVHVVVLVVPFDRIDCFNGSRTSQSSYCGRCSPNARLYVS